MKYLTLECQQDEKLHSGPDSEYLNDDMMMIVYDVLGTKP